MSRNRKVLKEILSWFMAFFIPLVIVFFLNMEVFAISGIDQSSMHNTLFEGEMVYYNRVNYNINTIKRGDIILFLANGKIKDGFFSEVAIKAEDFADKFKKKGVRANERYIKRVIGLPGDIIDIRDKEVYVNGVKEIQTYVVGATPTFDGQYPITVPEGRLFVMGDNREVSKDSRSIGCIDVRSVEGKASMVLWPLDRMGKPN